MMKTPAFWFTPPGLLVTMLLPFSWIWRAGTACRRWFVKPQPLPIPLIIVGNAVAGGVGKTPVTTALATYLQAKGRRVHIVAKGYGGSLFLPTRLLPTHTAHEVGDEPLLLNRVAPTYIGRDRLATARMAVVGADVIISDDGLQNPHLAPTLSLLVVDGRGAGNGLVIPAGPLREPLPHVLARSHAVVATHDKTPDYGLPKLGTQLEICNPEVIRGQRVLAFAGLGQPEKFFATCREAGAEVVATAAFPDHYFYKAEELERLAQSSLALVTTRKDWVRLPPAWQARVLCLDIRLEFADTKQLDEILTRGGL